MLKLVKPVCIHFIQPKLSSQRAFLQSFPFYQDQSIFRMLHRYHLFQNGILLESIHHCTFRLRFLDTRETILSNHIYNRQRCSGNLFRICLCAPYCIVVTQPLVCASHFSHKCQWQQQFFELSIHWCPSKMPDPFR